MTTFRSRPSHDGVAHTPGRWILGVTDKYFEYRYVYGPGDNAPIACVFVGGTRRPKRESAANSRLIAAAPDLLSSLKALLDIADRMTTGGVPAPDVERARDAARAAVKKAAATSIRSQRRSTNAGATA